ncbi:unnamed protein product [Phytophthora lilii]|uniref:Unnamed protein product n=1 Tax=Phytophthora lilii TaxID=2077276 RepID=A0A9W6WY41_9STRA|nr:unnamed protein product [Phytophthora lilii]
MDRSARPENDKAFGVTRSPTLFNTPRLVGWAGVLWLCMVAISYLSKRRPQLDERSALGSVAFDTTGVCLQIAQVHDDAHVAQDLFNLMFRLVGDAGHGDGGVDRCEHHAGDRDSPQHVEPSTRGAAPPVDDAEDDCRGCLESAHRKQREEVPNQVRVDHPADDDALALFQAVSTPRAAYHR